MDPFSYLSVLLSLILGLGITHLLTGLGRLVHARARVRIYWPTLLWVAMLLLVYVQSWWAMFGLRHHQPWTFPQFFVVLLHTTASYFMAAVLLPEDLTEETSDLRATFFTQAPWFFGTMALTTVASVAKNLVLDGELPEPANLGFHVLFFTMSVAGAVVRNERFHRLLPVSGLGIFALYVGLLFWRLEA
jgi:hypothetical protein